MWKVRATLCARHLPCFSPPFAAIPPSISSSWWRIGKEFYAATTGSPLEPIDEGGEAFDDEVPLRRPGKDWNEPLPSLRASDAEDGGDRAAMGAGAIAVTDRGLFVVPMSDASVDPMHERALSELTELLPPRSGLVLVQPVAQRLRQAGEAPDGDGIGHRAAIDEGDLDDGEDDEDGEYFDDEVVDPLDEDEFQGDDSADSDEEDDGSGGGLAALLQDDGDGEDDDGYDDHEDQDSGGFGPFQDGFNPFRDFRN